MIYERRVAYDSASGRKRAHIPSGTGKTQMAIDGLSDAR